MPVSEIVQRYVTNHLQAIYWFYYSLKVISFEVTMKFISVPNWSSRYIRYRMYPSQNSGRAAFPHPALYETHYSTIIRKY